LKPQRDFHAYLGDDEQNNKYVNIFVLLSPISLVGVLFTDCTIIHFGFAGSLHGVNILTLAYNLIKVSSDKYRSLALFYHLSTEALFVWGNCEFPPNHLASPTSDPKGSWHHV
jgi:hypothetical protein